MKRTNKSACLRLRQLNIPRNLWSGQCDFNDTRAISTCTWEGGEQNLTVRPISQSTKAKAGSPATAVFFAFTLPRSSNDAGCQGTILSSALCRSNPEGTYAVYRSRGEFQLSSREPISEIFLSPSLSFASPSPAGQQEEAMNTRIGLFWVLLSVAVLISTIFLRWHSALMRKGCILQTRSLIQNGLAQERKQNRCFALPVQEISPWHCAFDDEHVGIETLGHCPATLTLRGAAHAEMIKL